MSETVLTMTCMPLPEFELFTLWRVNIIFLRCQMYRFLFIYLKRSYILINYLRIFYNNV